MRKKPFVSFVSSMDVWIDYKIKKMKGKFKLDLKINKPSLFDWLTEKNIEYCWTYTKIYPT